MPNGHASSFEAWNSVTYCSKGYILCSLMKNKQTTLFSEEEVLKVLYKEFYNKLNSLQS